MKLFVKIVLFLILIVMFAFTSITMSIGIAFLAVGYSVLPPVLLSAAVLCGLLAIFFLMFR